MSEVHSLTDLSISLCETRTEAGTTFQADVFDADNGLTVIATSSICPDFPLVITQTNKQILSVIDLFSLSDVKPELRSDLDRALLALSPVIPLSSFGTIGDQVVLFGSMPVETLMHNIIHELEVQSNNCLEALDVLEEMLIEDSVKVESV